MGIEVLLELAGDALDERVALSGEHGALTFGELRRRARSGAGLLRAPGARSVAFVGQNGPAFCTAVFATAYAGLPLTPLNYRLPAAELETLIERLDAPTVLVDEQMRAALPAALVTHSTEDWFAATATHPPLPDVAEPDSAAVVLFTSGTTATPKAVVLRHDNLLSYLLETVEALGADEQECALVAVPPYHIAGIASVLSNVCAGRRVVHLPRFVAAEWLATVRREQVTSAMVVPTMLARIVTELDGQPADVPSLRSLAYGGARVSPRVVEEALDAMPDVGFVNAYGLTETSSTVAVLGPADHREALASDDDAVRERLRSVGRATPGIEFEVRDEVGTVLGAGVTGRLFVRGAQVSGEYVGPGSTLDAEGWFDTRDRARVDEHGYVYIDGRGDDTIIRGGENIAPAEVEDVLMQHPDVADAAVVGLPDDEWGQRIAAVVVPRDVGAGLAPDLREFTRERLRGSRMPDVIQAWPELPYTPTGKLLRRNLVVALMESNEGVAT